MKNQEETNMKLSEIKKAMLTMSQSEISQIEVYAQRLKYSTGVTFSIGQSVMVVQKTKTTPAKILKMNPKKAQVEMMWNNRGLTKVNVPYSMLVAA